MRDFHEVRNLPSVPAVYLFWSRDANGRGRIPYPVYVGLTGDLRVRMVQHLWRRDSSVTTGTQAVILNPDYVTDLHWWTDPQFGDRSVLEAAEEVASRKFEPVLRDRGRLSKAAEQLLSEPHLRGTLETLFSAPPSGILTFASIEDVVEHVRALERQVMDLQDQLARPR